MFVDFVVSDQCKTSNEFKFYNYLLEFPTELVNEMKISRCRPIHQTTACGFAVPTRLRRVGRRWWCHCWLKNRNFQETLRPARYPELFLVPYEMGKPAENLGIISYEYHWISSYMGWYMIISIYPYFKSHIWNIISISVIYDSWENHTLNGGSWEFNIEFSSASLRFAPRLWDTCYMTTWW